MKASFVLAILATLVAVAYCDMGFPGVQLPVARVEPEDCECPKAEQPVNLALGFGARADGWKSVALGNLAHAFAKESIAIGDATTAHDEDCLALGDDATASVEDALAIGDDANATGLGAISFGADSTSLADGAVSLGYESHCVGPDSIAIGHGASATSSSGGAIAIGKGTTVLGSKSVGLGVENTISGAYSVGVGYQVSAPAAHSIGLGRHVVVTGEGAIAIGLEAYANAQNEVIIGNCPAVDARQTGVGSPAGATYDEHDPLFAVGAGRTTDGTATCVSHANGMTLWKSGDLHIKGCVCLNSNGDGTRSETATCYGDCLGQANPRPRSTRPTRSEDDRDKVIADLLARVEALEKKLASRK